MLTLYAGQPQTASGLAARSALGLGEQCYPSHDVQAFQTGLITASADLPPPCCRVARVEQVLNERPRKRLDYRSPSEILAKRICCN